VADETIIAWTDHTLNLWMGCAKVSEGCRNCYAETLTKNRMGLTLWGPQAKRQETKSPWQNARRWNAQAAAGVCPKCRNSSQFATCNYCGSSGRAPGNYGQLPDGRTPHLVFLGSLMDWAEDRRDLDQIRVRMWELIRNCPHLWFQMLTKRPENIGKFLPADWGSGYPNVWLGTTVEDNRVKERVKHLTGNPAVVHFISNEPAIGPSDEIELDDIEWVITGGESGPGYRPLDMRQARHMRDRCVERGTAFFMKQDAAHRTEIRPFLVEQDGSQWAWKQYPGKLDPPVRMAA
jgi:protein gp37